MPNPTECKSCGTEIVWMKTRNDKNIPVDLPDEEDPMRDEVLECELFDRDKHKTHFETCPNSEKHRGSTHPKAEAPGETNLVTTGLMAKKLNTAMAALEDIAKNPADGMRSVTIARAALSQIRAINA